MNAERKKIILRYEQFDIRMLLILGFLAGLAITYTYASSSLAVYGIFFGVVLVYTYAIAFLRFFRMDKICLSLIVIILFIAVINGIIRWDVMDSLRMNLSLMLPLTVSTLNINNMENKNGWLIAATFSMMVMAYMILGKQMLTTSEVNENSIAFLGYMAASLGFFWFKLEKKKMLSSLFLVASFLLLASAQCRNLLLVFPMCIILLLVPQRLWKKKWFYRMFYLFAIIYTICASEVLQRFFTSDLYVVVKDYVNVFAEHKSGSMVSRVSFFEKVKGTFASLPWYEQLFGRGIRQSVHCHNMFLQSLFIYGYLGTALVYLFFVRIFEIGYKLIKEKQDTITLCCAIVLWGHFVLNGADLYLIGTDCVAIMPQIMMGIILYRYRTYRQEVREIICRK